MCSAAQYLGRELSSQLWCSPSPTAPLPPCGLSSPFVCGHFLGETFFSLIFPALPLLPLWAFPGGSVIKNLPTSSRDARHVGSVPESESSPGVGNGNPPSILAWKIPWTEGPGGLQSMGSQRVGRDWTINPTIPQGVWRCHLIGKEEREVEREVSRSVSGKKWKVLFWTCWMWHAHEPCPVGKSWRFFHRWIWSTRRRLKWGCFKRRYLKQGDWMRSPKQGIQRKERCWLSGL